jgi:hypothetical protein
MSTKSAQAVVAYFTHGEGKTRRLRGDARARKVAKRWAAWLRKRAA